MKVRDLRKVAASQDIGTRMVMEAQIESGAFASQSVGGPLNVTSMLAAVVAKKSIQRPRHDRKESRGLYLFVVKRESLSKDIRTRPATWRTTKF
jgi:hypothetical protein